MPELPEVETMKKYTDSTALHHTIQKVKVNNDKVLNMTGRTLKRNLKGQKFTQSRRHGKFLMLEIDNGRWLILHFGMTGNLNYYKDPEQSEKNERVQFHFQNGYTFAFVCPRLFGEIDLTDDSDDYLKQRDVGPDVLNLERDEFVKLLKDRRGAIKSTLMNQKIMSGIGNLYSDEILYQTKIDPRRKSNDLDESDLKGLYKKMRYVLEKAVDFRSAKGKPPRTWLLAHRSEGESCPRCDGSIKRIKISGRNGYMCDRCQQ